jgi:endonuclease/exonuclease/phosphatase family metal-dependent hydrolase
LIPHVHPDGTDDHVLYSHSRHGLNLNEITIAENLKTHGYATGSPASKGWDAAFPRVVTWAELRDRSAGAKDAHFFYFNTHWDHKGEQARLQSAQLMRRRIEQIAGDAPVIVKGDFCCSDDSKAYQFLVNPTGVDAGKPRLIDSYREFHPQHEATDFTFHGFTGTNTKPSRIDWILHTPEFKAARCEIDRTNAQGRYPSDHFPVIAVLK